MDSCSLEMALDVTEQFKGLQVYTRDCRRWRQT